jgi:hypothetical protein
MSCWNCGDDDHYANVCPARQAAAHPQPPAGYGLQVEVSDLRRPASEICPPELVPVYAQQIRDRLTHGMPAWLWRRMQAWHQVAESRRTRT